MMKKGIIKAISILTAFVIFCSTPASALSRSDANKFSANNILFYDPVGNNCDFVSYTTKPSGDQITWIGDSYSVGAESIISEKLPGVDFGVSVNNSNSYIQGSKWVYGGTSDNPSGLTILENIISDGKLRPYLVFALGTNGGWTDESMSQLLDLLDNTKTKVVLVTSKTPNSSYQDSNNIIKTAAANNANIFVADWTLVYKEDYFSADPERIHPSTNGGYEAWVNAIYDALPGSSTRSLPGSTNSEKVWNYFVQANIAGVSDNAAAIAGIIGNFMQESGVDPFVHRTNGSYYGIYQSKIDYEPGLVEAIENAGLSQYWYDPYQTTSRAPQDAVDQAITIELDWLTKSNSRFSTDGWSYLKNLSNVSQQTPESYAELFEVSVEGAVTSNTNSNNQLLDPGVISVGTKYFSNANGGGKYYQEVKQRRDYARDFYDKSATSISLNSNAVSSSSAIMWDSNGWITSGMPGYTKEDANHRSDLQESAKPIGGYSTANGKPNKILLHNTEGTASGLNAYGGNMFPAHFTIDLKKKVVSQHFSIWQPSLSLVGDEAAGVQIEIVGFSTSASANSPYYLPSFTASEWDYLAVLLGAIAQETNVPLTSTVSWQSGTPRLSEEAFLNYSGVIGHMHAPRNDHIDPGDIWQYVDAAIARNPSASSFRSQNSGVCTTSNYGAGLISGGMNLQQAKEFMQVYRDITPREWAEGGSGILGPPGTDYDIAPTNCENGDLENCVAFSTYFVNRYTTAHFKGLPNGSNVVDRLVSSNQGFENGGTVPRAYAVFSVASGTTRCGDKLCGHTGVVLGIDSVNNKIIIGEAGCSASIDFTDAHEYDLDRFTNNGYTYAYTDNILKGL